MVDTAAPLARMWRSVYQKASEAAAARTADLLRDHVYLFHRNLPTGGGGGGFVGCGAFNAAGTLTFPTGSYVNVPFTSEQFDLDGFHDPAGATPDRFTCPTGKGGYYRASVQLRLPFADPTKEWLVAVTPTSDYDLTQTGHFSAAFETEICFTTPAFALPDGAYVRVQVAHNAGATISTSGAPPLRFLLEQVG